MLMKKRKVKIEFDGYWYWISSPRDFSCKITGKYLFFSSNQRRLIKIATAGRFVEESMP